jgi:hypothetical protein
MQNAGFDSDTLGNREGDAKGCGLCMTQTAAKDYHRQRVLIVSGSASSFVLRSAETSLSTSAIK